MDIKIFRSNENLRTIILEDNPWRCDCRQLSKIFVYLTGLPQKTESDSLICQSPSNFTGYSWETACYKDWSANRYSNKDRTWSLIMMTLLIVVFIIGSIIFLRHTWTMKRAARRERLRLAQEEGVERLRLLRRR